MRESKAAASAVIPCLAALAFLGGSWRSLSAQIAGGPEETWRTSDLVVRATNRGVALMEQYDYAGAVKAFEEVYKLAPESTEARVNLAIAMYNRCTKGDLERGEKLLDSVVGEDPGNVRALYFRGITHQYRGRDEQAISYFERVVKLLPHEACAWYLLARSKSHLGQPCRTELERSIQENPALVSAYYDLMRVARQEGDQEAARFYKDKFIRLRQSPLADKIVMPNYNQMGPLATVRPVLATPQRSVASGELSAGPVRTIWSPAEPVSLPSSGAPEAAAAIRNLTGGFGQPAFADVNRDGRLDMVTTTVGKAGRRGLRFLIGRAEGRFADSTASSGLAGVDGVVSCAFGDYDNDGHIDLFVSCAGPNHLFRGLGDGSFEDVTAKTNTAGRDVISASAVFLDADHDADLDIYVCNAASADGAAPAANQLLNNNADGTFTDIASAAGVSCPLEQSIMLAPADIDGDRDSELVVFNVAGPARVFFNDRLGKYHEEQLTDEPIRGDFGGVLQDFNGDGQVDLLVSPGKEAPGRLYLADGTGALKASSQFDGCLKAIVTWGAVRAMRVADMDLDGDFDIVVFAADGHVLLNDGWGRFVAKPRVWPGIADESVVGAGLTDFTGDGVPDVLRVRDYRDERIELVPTTLTPPANWLAVTPTGDRGDDQRTRSPASGFGTRMEVRCGIHNQAITYTGLSGGLSQSRQPVVFGLSGATKVDFLALVWPDGVTQYEGELTAGTHHRIREMERRVSSCPVLFAWNGTHFGFIGDFAGVGGLGYYVAPGEYAQPQALEHVRIGPEQLAPKDGFYELRLAEPMEEVAYIDRLELVAVDHPRELSVYPDERLAITGPPPTHELLCPAKPIFPITATAPDGTECADRLTEADRVYAYQPQFDHRFVGFCRSHSLVVDFGDRLAELEPESPVYLFINGWIEYPYSQTTYAAAQAGVNWEPMRIEQRTGDGQWETIVADAGAPGGLGRMIAVNLTGKLSPDHCALRITTNLEIYLDQLFIAADRGTGGFAIRTVPLAEADLRRVGFPMEYSPDGQHPTVYTYDVIQPTSSFKMPKGAYTRYGAVETLLENFDDRYVILGTGDEIAVRFDARKLPSPKDGEARTFVLVSHAYCKDMDLYTAAPDTVEPLPFKDMSAYPYPPRERDPAQDTLDRYHQRFNTRSVD